MPVRVVELDLVKIEIRGIQDLLYREIDNLTAPLDIPHKIGMKNAIHLLKTLENKLSEKSEEIIIKETIKPKLEH